MIVKAEIPKDIANILDIFSKAGYEIYLVGGVVRDILLKRITNDWDFTTNATPSEILKLISGGIYNNKYGTVFTDNPTDPSRPHEITTFRREEGYSDSRHPDKIIWGKTLKEDLTRREATISAMALKPTGTEGEFELIDPFLGQKDLQKKIFRAVGDPNERFAEDALRMMRAIRISAQLGFIIEKKTFEGIQNNATLINKIAKERVKEELFKILASDYPYEGILLLKNSGLLEHIIPELEKCFGIEQKSPERHHIYDVGTHSLMSLKHCKSKDPLVRFAALIHDIGKPQTYGKLPNGVITFYNHEIVGTKIAWRIAKRLHFSNKEREKLATLVRWHQFSVDERQTDSAIRRFIRNVGKENISDMLDLRVGDRLGGGARETSWRLEEFKKRLIEVQREPFSIKDLKIDGNDVMEILKLKPGPKVGEVLNKTFEMVENKKLENKKPQLIEFVKTLSQESPP
jgi:putative nucleotidyltransferase with HDIG domain